MRGTNIAHIAKLGSDKPGGSSTSANYNISNGKNPTKSYGGKVAPLLKPINQSATSKEPPKKTTNSSNAVPNSSKRNTSNNIVVSAIVKKMTTKLHKANLLTDVAQQPRATMNVANLHVLTNLKSF